MELHAGYSLDVSRNKVHGNDPHPITKIRTVHQGIGLGREILAAVTAPIRLGLSGLADLNVVRSAPRAMHPVRPSVLGKPLLSRCIVGEPIEQFHQRQTLSERLPRSFPLYFHETILPKRGDILGKTLYNPLKNPCSLYGSK